MSGEPARFSIADLDPGDGEAIRQAAELLVEGFRDDWPEAWPTTDAALREVHEALGEGRIARVAVDESGMTSLSGVDLYPNVLEHLANIENLRGHPYEFYQRLGFSIIGVMPDANGAGKPDIYMAKCVGT